MDKIDWSGLDAATVSAGNVWILYAVLGLCFAGFAWIAYYLLIGRYRVRRRRRKHREML